jgi:hypothetical protein
MKMELQWVVTALKIKGVFMLNGKHVLIVGVATLVLMSVVLYVQKQFPGHEMWLSGVLHLFLGAVGVSTAIIAGKESDIEWDSKMSKHVVDDVVARVESGSHHRRIHADTNLEVIAHLRMLKAHVQHSGCSASLIDAIDDEVEKRKQEYLTGKKVA